MTRLKTATCSFATALALGACSPVGTIDEPAGQTGTQELPELEAHGIDIAACSLTDPLTLSCAWANEEEFIDAPINRLQATMGVFVKAQERALPESNEGGVAIYDLSQTSYEAGARLLFKTEVIADWNGEDSSMFYEELVFEAAEVEAGVELTTPLEVWSIGVVAADRNVVAELSFDGVMPFDSGELLLEEGKGPMTWTMIVDPSIGVDLLSNGNLVVEGALPGYYQFEDAYTATRHGSGAADTEVPPEQTDPVDEEPPSENPV